MNAKYIRSILKDRKITWKPAAALIMTFTHDRFGENDHR